MPAATTVRRPDGDDPAPTRPTGRQRRASARRWAEQARTEATSERQGLPRFTLVVGVAALVALLLGAALATGFLTPPGGSSAPARPPAATVDALVRGTGAADMTVAGRRGWVLDDGTGTIRAFDPATGAFTGPGHQVAQRPVSVVAADGELWVADAVGNAVVVIDPRTGRAVGTPIAVAGEPVSVAAGDGGIWVASLAGSAVSLIDPRTRSVVASVALPDGAVRVTTGDGAVWVTGTSDTLARISPRPVGVSLDWRAIRVGQGPIGVVAAPGAVWVADAVGGAVSRVDPRRFLVTATFRVGADGAVSGPESRRDALGPGLSDPVAVAWFDGLLWVGDGRAATVSALDPGTGTAKGASVSLRAVPRRLVAVDGALWATTANPGDVLQIHPS